MLELQSVHAHYNEKQIIHDFSYTFEKGKFYGILGPNGSGKSTLLKVMSGVMQPSNGIVTLNDVGLNQIGAKQLAKRMAVLTQFHSTSFTNTVRETVAIGRYPYQGRFFSNWTQQDEKAVADAMERTGVSEFQHVSMDYLSGGEQQRVFIAQALAQQAEMMLLDEPTNHLDISYQKQTLDLMLESVQKQGITVIGIFHDINLASLYCDELILLEKGRIHAAGSPQEVVRKTIIEEVYQAQISIYAHPEHAKPQITLIPSSIVEEFTITKSNVERSGDFLEITVKQPLKTISSAVYNAGLGWYTSFVNRTVEQTYVVENVEQEVEQFLLAHHYVPALSVVMLTAVPMGCAVIENYEFEDCSIVVVVTAGTKHAIDVSKAIERSSDASIGTINTFVFINGELSDEAFYQAMITATEAKAKALFDEQIQDPLTHTVATGTGTDSLLIAATQQGHSYRYAGPLTNIGKTIGHGVYDATKKAIINYNNYVSNGE